MTMVGLHEQQCSTVVAALLVSWPFGIQFAAVRQRMIHAKLVRYMWCRGCFSVSSTALLSSHTLLLWPALWPICGCLPCLPALYTYPMLNTGLPYFIAAAAHVQVVTCVRMVGDLLRSEDPGFKMAPKPQVTSRFMVLPEMIGPAIIGKGGTHAKHIKERTSCRIEVVRKFRACFGSLVPARAGTCSLCRMACFSTRPTHSDCLPQHKGVQHVPGRSCRRHAASFQQCTGAFPSGCLPSAYGAFFALCQS